MSLVSISPKAKIGNNCRIREFSVIEDDVIIGDNCEIGPSAFIGNGSRIGNGVRILHCSSIAIWPNSVTYNGENTIVEIGDGTFIKGHMTVCRGTKFSYKTVIGQNCYLMNHVHVAHDNIIGDNVTMVNGTNLGGHVEIDSNTTVGGLVGIHQFCKIGKYCMIESSTKVRVDIPPFILAGRVPQRFMGINSVGLKRAGFDTSRIEKIKDVYRKLYGSGFLMSDTLEKIKSDFTPDDDLNDIINFIEKRSNRGIIKK